MRLLEDNPSSKYNSRSTLTIDESLKYNNTNESPLYDDVLFIGIVNGMIEPLFTKIGMTLSEAGMLKFEKPGMR